ncbi:nitrate reductase [Thiomonas sp. FB-6]|uniref:nitrate reductase n=1 Tax=Thiomonas sp. FB-6 TaxID=1158291 RepID=UPI000399C621|nr:nitrate reductase [Thiomonas sp. FB-6]
MSETASTCPYCGVGCGVLIDAEGGAIRGVRGDPAHPANLGRLCSKGATLHLSAQPGVLASARALHPRMRASREGPMRRVGWDEALEHLAGRFADIVARHGPDAVGFYVSGQLLTEDYYVFNKLAKGLIGTNNIDTNSRLCMSSAVAAYKRALGADAPPPCYEDLDAADCLFIAGSNTAWAHPILFRRIEQARRERPQLKIVVVDPRRTETAEIADLHLALQPGTDVALFHGMLHAMLWDGLVDTAYIARHTAGFEALREAVRPFTPAFAAQLCGLREQDVVQAARWFAGLRDDGGRGATLSLYCQGLNQSSAGTDKNLALLNLHLACGQIGREGAGPLSLTGQPNAMGGREVGGMANLLSGHRDLANAGDRAEVAALWGVDQVPAQPGLTAVDMFRAAAQGRLKALWIACTNPLQSLPNAALVREALQRAELVVVQEAFEHTASAGYAHVLLPAASWGEKQGTVTNSERRISRVRAAVAPPGQARADWEIAADFGRRLEARMRPGRASMFAWPDARAVWNEHRESTRGRDLDITGLSWDLLEREGPQQWPFPTGAARGRQRLYADGRFATPDARARLCAVEYRPVAEARDARFPFALNTGRLRDQWHGMSRSGSVPRLFAHRPAPSVDLHPGDMARRGLAEGDLVRLSSRRGTQVLPARADPGLAPGQAFVAMHWGPEYLGGTAGNGKPTLGVNGLTLDVLDPVSRQPELKHAAVKVLRAELPWRLCAFGWLEQGGEAPLRRALMDALRGLDYLSCVPFGRERCGLALHAAGHEPPDEASLRFVAGVFGLDAPQVLRYRDSRTRDERRVLLRGDALHAVLLCGGPGAVAAEAWLRELLESQAPARTLGRLLLAPGARAPLPAAGARGAQVCNCLDVRAGDIARELAASTGDAADRLAALQRRLGCGTQCGSCLPTLRRMAAEASSLGVPA